jgi:signal transduction histidine kinase
MYEIELTQPVQLSGVQTRLLDLHSVLNVLTVVANELNILNLLAGSPPSLDAPRAHIQTLKAVFLDDQVALSTKSGQLSQAHQDILSAVQTLLTAQPELAQEIDLPLFQRNLVSLFQVLEIRYQELAQREHNPLQWGKVSNQTLRQNLIHVFEAMELNSHGRYHIVYSSSEKQTEDYLIEIQIESSDQEMISLPLVLQDIMRDLSANARKYSQPGARICTHLTEKDQSLLLSVEDSGMGIPEAELEQIVAFGQRGSNVKEKRTMGGGFGLTKAWYFTHLLSGRMWLASQLHQGTRIRIEIPVPIQENKAVF